MPKNVKDLLPEVATAKSIKTEAKKITRRQLAPEALEIAQEWAKDLIPADPTKPPSYITIADEELDLLTEKAAGLLSNVSVDMMDEVDAQNKGVKEDFKLINIDDLSPYAKRIWLFFRESADMIAKRIRKVLNKYKTMEGRYQMRMAEAIRMRDQYVELENHADEIGDETRKSRYIVRIAAEACKIYLETYGAQTHQAMIDEVAAQQKLADDQGYELDEKWTEDLATFKDYLVMVEQYMLDMETAAQTAAMTYAGFNALETNMRLVAQSLHIQAKVVIPNWMRMVGIKYIAYMGNKAQSYLDEQNQMNVQIITETAASLEMVFENIAHQLARGQYSQEAMAVLNDVLVNGNEKMITAVAEFRTSYAVTTAAYSDMKEKLDAVRLKYGQSK
jgi:hypothetical protein